MWDNFQRLLELKQENFTIRTGKNSTEILGYSDVILCVCVCVSI